MTPESSELETNGLEGGAAENSWAKFGIDAGSKEWLAFSSDTERTLGSFSNNSNLASSGVFGGAVGLTSPGDVSAPSSRTHFLSPLRRRLPRVGGEPRVSGLLACA